MRIRNAATLVLFICSINFCWIRIWKFNSGSGSRQKFRIHADADLDPQHWKDHKKKKGKIDHLLIMILQEERSQEKDIKD